MPKKGKQVEAAPLPSPPQDRRSKTLERMASRMQSWRPAREVLKRVRAVPTCFPWLDYATRIGGLPVGRMSVIHGPSSEGKTACALGLGLSFLRRGHFFGYIDAEMTSPITWLEGLMAEHVDSPLLLSLRPKSYEQTVDAVREMLKTIIAAKETGEMPDAAGIIVVDSLRKLVPEDFLEKIRKFGAQGQRGSVDGMSGMGPAIKAKMNADWFDELTPLLYRADVAMLLIGRESVNRDAVRGGPSWKLTGGGAVLFEVSLAMRCERDWVREGAGPDAVILGERHDVSIYKSKVAGKDDREVVWSFHTSNGKLTPEGFDLARDLFELGSQLGVVSTSGSYFGYGGVRWQGKSRAVKRLSDDAELRGKLEAAVRARFDNAVSTEGLAPIVQPKEKRT
jgi:recombination protein RecA